MNRQTKDLWKKEEIIEQIKKKAKSYVPEWRFDAEFPDIGTALAFVYADMLSKTAKKFDSIFLKNRIAFLNELNAKLLPALPASGCVTFSLVNDEVEGVELPAGTIIGAQSEQEEIGIIHYQTTDDVYVSPARICSFFHSSDQDDFIAQVYKPEEGNTEEITLFDLSRPNLQKHELYFCHSEALYIKESGRIQLSFYVRDNTCLPEAYLKKLTDLSLARFEYYTCNGYERFERQEFKDGDIFLYKGEGQPPFEKTEVDKAEGYFIRCVLLDIKPFQELEFRTLLMRTWANYILPDSIYANGIESDKNHYFPFGERITNFTEVYFGCEEALHKRGAQICLAFHLNFAKIPLDYNIENDPIKWEWIMKLSDFKTDPEYDVTIEEVLWEYYNGTGFTRLFPDNRLSDVFLPKNGIREEYKKIEFICPDDIEPLTINSCHSYYIRARVIKVNNLFKMKGAYISPILEDTIFEYDYKGHEVKPDHIISHNNLEVQRTSLGGTSKYRPFIQNGDKNPTLYLGFKIALSEGPVKIFFFLKDNIARAENRLLWEYYDGMRWKEINLVDETQCFSRSGIVTMTGKKDFAKKRIFGEELYWIRITDIKNSYSLKNRITALPIVKGIYLNTTKIKNVDKSATEYFQMEIYQENTQFTLADRKIIEAEVFVNEVDNLRTEEYKKLTEENRLKPVYDEAGILKEAWVKWNQVEDFSDSGEMDRDYVLDKNEGFLIFGNGNHGRIPLSSRTENIRVEYLVGGGEYTNVAADMVRQMNQEIGFINQIRNPQALTGGCNIESLEDALVRNSAKIRHQNRAVTVRDYEEIAIAASRMVKKVKCFSGYDIYGKECLGAITLVVLQKDFEGGREQFNSIKEEIEAYMKDKVEGNLFCMGRFSIIEPEFVELSIRAELIANSYNAAFQVKKTVSERLTAFLNPLMGNFHSQGWEIGKLPNSIQIRNVIADIPHLMFVRNIYISAFINGHMGRREVDLEHIRKNRYILPINGQHEAIIDIG